MGVQRYAAALLAATFLALAGLLAAASAAEPIKNSACLECHSDKTLTKTNAAGKEISLFVDAAKLAASAHKTNTCASCHADITTEHPDDNVAAKPVNCQQCHERQTESYGASVHGLALAKGDGLGHLQDCHDSHRCCRPPHRFAAARLAAGGDLRRVPRSGGEGFAGQRSRQSPGRRRPRCAHLHGLPFRAQDRGAQGQLALKISEDVCSRCHASERSTPNTICPPTACGRSSTATTAWPSQYGSTLAANCGSCHGYHKILPSTDPRSTIHKTHLVETCGKCHPGATEKFALSKVHVDIAATSDGAGHRQPDQLVGAADLSAADLRRGRACSSTICCCFGRRSGAHFRAADLTVLRMSLSQRWQHALLAVSFIVLAITGFALKFPDSWVAS